MKKLVFVLLVFIMAACEKTVPVKGPFIEQDELQFRLVAADDSTPTPPTGKDIVIPDP